MIDERFARTELIFGEAGMQRLQSARVAVFGVGVLPVAEITPSLSARTPLIPVPPISIPMNIAYPEKKYLKPTGE